MIDFSFISDARIRKILERDYHELQQLNTGTAPKAVIVLSGGIIEGMLFDALVAGGRWSFEEASNNTLKKMIDLAKTSNIITEDRLTDATRKYRNLIHVGHEIKAKMVFEETDAVVAKAAVGIVAREVRNWAIARGYTNVPTAGVTGSGAPPPTAPTPPRPPADAATSPIIIEVNKSQAVVEESTQVTVTVLDVYQTRQVLLRIALPGQEPQKFPEAVVGDVWRFERHGTKYRIMLLEVNWVKDKVKFEIRPDPDAN